jgi:hypothetical protein
MCQHKHVLAQIDDLLGLEAVVLPRREDVRQQLSHPLDTPIDVPQIDGMQLEVRSDVALQKCLRSLRVAPRPGLADLTYRSTFSCDIAYVRTPTASSASFRST